MKSMRFLLELAWRDLRGSGRSLWVFCACLALGVSLVSASGSLYRLTSIGLLDSEMFSLEKIFRLFGLFSLAKMKP